MYILLKGLRYIKIAPDIVCGFRKKSSAKRELKQKGFQYSKIKDLYFSDTEYFKLKKIKIK